MRPGVVVAVAACLLAAGLLNLPARAETPPVSAAPWTEGPVADDASDPVPPGMPFDDGRHMRIHLRVDVPDDLGGARDIPVTHTLDVAKALSSSEKAWPAPYPSLSTGQLLGFELDLDSLTLVEVDPETLHPLHTEAGQAQREALMVFPGSFEDPRPFDARSNPVVTLQWVLRGASEDERHYMLYLDSLHNGRKTPATVPEDALAAVASSTGPGRGDRLYVPLHGDLGVQASQDPRAIRVTNTGGGDTEVTVTLYDRFGLPQAQPTASGTLHGLGYTREFRLPLSYAGSAALVEAEGGLVTAEASSDITSSQYVAGSGRAFLAAADGGFTGQTFAETPAHATRWLVFCPTVPANTGDCRVSLDGGGAQTVKRNDFHAFDVAAGQPTVLEALEGEVAVQRVPPSGTPGQLAPSLWPPMDGPIASSLFMGHSLSEDESTRDKLLLMPAQPATSLSVRSMVGARDLLADRLDVGGPGLFTDSAGNGWGTTWGRDWRIGSEPRDHEDGPARLQVLGGGRATVASGQATDVSTFSALVPLQSPDGGLLHQFALPSDNRGVPLGRLVLFSPHSGTNVVVSGVTASGDPFCCLERLSLQADQFVSDLVTEAGWWTVEADRPVVLAWTHVGSDPMSGFAPAVTDALDVEVVSAQHTGFLFDVRPDQSFKTVRPGTSAEFVVQVENLARTVGGERVRDRVQLEARVPQGWPTPEVSPSVLDLGSTAADGSGVATVKVHVPAPPVIDPTDGGATVTLTASSANEPRLRISQGLGINYLLQRGVQVTANGSPLDAEIGVAPDENATYRVLVTNTGSVRDRFHIEHSLASSGWTMEVLCALDGFKTPDCSEEGSMTTPLLDPQQSMEFVFTIGPGADVTTSRLPTVFLATSQSDPSKKASIRLITLIATDRSLTITAEDPNRVVPPGTSTTFNLTLTNSADLDEELALRVEPLLPDAWNPPEVEVLLVDADERVPLDALGGVVPVPRNSHVDVWIRQEVPAGAPPHLLGLDRVVADSRLTASAPRVTAELRTIVEEVRGFDAAASPPRLAAVPGEEIRFDVTYTSRGNGDQNLTVLPAPHAGTAWEFTDGDGRPPPWELALPAGGQASLSVAARVPADAPPLAAGLLLDLRSTVKAHPTIPVPVLLDVAREPAIGAPEGTLVLLPGRDNAATAAVTNLGNVPLDVEARWDGLPWEVEPVRAHLPTGASRDLEFTIPLPAPVDASAVPTTARLTVSDADGATSETREWVVRVAQPRLEAEVTDISGLDGGGRVFHVDVRNVGDTAAHGVVVELLDGKRVLDAVRIDAVPPGGSHVANLATRDDGDPVVRIRAEHEPAGFAAVHAQDGPPGDDRFAPGLGLWLVAAALMCIVGRRRQA